MSNLRIYTWHTADGGMCIYKKIKTYLFIILVVFSFFCCILPLSCLAQHDLQIHGPLVVFEGEQVEFIITYNGEPIQARIIFEDVYPPTFSNSTTGKVSFFAPATPYPNMQYVITASLFGEISVSHILTVKNITSGLLISLSEQYIVETEEFRVTITDGQHAVEGAYVWFNDELFITDGVGEVELSAPDVLVTTTFGLLVNKTGYEPVSTMITVYEDGRGMQLMDVSIPSIVEPGRTDLEVKVNSKAGPLADVSVDVFYEGELVGRYQTDASGTTLFSSPEINYDNYFTVTVSKQGYQTYFNDELYHISLFGKNLASDLFMTVLPSEVQEGGVVSIKVTNDVGIGVSDVFIWLGSEMFIQTTDSEGVLTFYSPSVFMDTQFYVYAMKLGYNFAQSFLTVRKSTAPELKLYIQSPSFVNESQLFSVLVIDQYNASVSDVLVVFNSEKQYTNEEGLVYFYAPLVSVSSFFTLEVSKTGFIPGFFSIEVINQQNQNDIVSRNLVISVQPMIFEKQTFIVTVRDGLGNAVSNALVSFRGITLNTDFRGQVVFSSPEVDWDEIHTVTVTKAGYSSASTTVTIKNVDGFNYWFLIIIIVAVFVIGVVAYIRYAGYF